MEVAVQPLRCAVERRRIGEHAFDASEHARVAVVAYAIEALFEPTKCAARRVVDRAKTTMHARELRHGRADERDVSAREISGADLAGKTLEEMNDAIAVVDHARRARLRLHDAWDADRFEHALFSRDLRERLAGPRTTQHETLADRERRIRVPARDRNDRGALDSVVLGEHCFHAREYTARAMRPSEQMRALNLKWIQEAAAHRHLFQQEWLGERFFHLPGDVVALQHLFWQVKPEVAILTGVAAGGGPIFAASMLELLGGDRSVIAIDPRIHDSVRAHYAEHPQAKRITLVEGSSIDAEVFTRVKDLAGKRRPVMVVLDLIHAHDHVRRELELYSELVSVGSYLVVLDTIMEDLPAEHFAGKPYGKGNNPGTAARAFLADDPRFEVDHDIEDRVLMTLAPGGFLRRAR